MSEYEKPKVENNRPEPLPGQVTVREAVISLFRSFGIDRVFGNPGSTELPMFRDYPKDFKYVLGLQESIVVGMADGYAQATRNAAVVNLHSAVGAGHAAGNIFTAFKNQTPLVITAGQQARSILPFEPFLYAQQASEFPMPYVKWSCEPARAEDVPLAMARAYYTAMQAPQGPTFVSVPIDDWDCYCDAPDARAISQQIQGEMQLLEKVAKALNNAQKPAFVVGAGVGREDAWDEIISLAQTHNSLVYASPMSARNSFPEDHALFAGFLAASRQEIVKALNGHDVIIVLGAPAFTYHVEGSGPHIPEGSELFQIVDNANTAAWSPVGTAVISSMKPALQFLNAKAAPKPRAVPDPRLAAAVLDGKPFNDKYVLQQLAKLRKPDSIIVEEAPSCRGPMHDYLPILERDTFYTCASGGLGHGLPAAVGVAMARPKDKVIALLGDGSAMFAIQGLWSAVNQNLPITFIIINNASYAALKMFGRIFDLDEVVGSNLGGIDFVSVGQGMGCDGARVDNPQDLDEAISTAINASGPYVLEVVVES